MFSHDELGRPAIKQVKSWQPQYSFTGNYHQLQDKNSIINNHIPTHLVLKEKYQM